MLSTIEYSRCPGCSRCSRCTRCLRCSRCSRCTRCRVTSRRVVSRRRSRICIFVAVGVVVVVVVVGLRRAAVSGSAYFHIAFVLSRPRFPSSHASVYDFTYFSNIRRNLHQSVTDWCRFSPYIWPRGPTMREFFLTPSPVVGLLPTHSSQQWLRRLVWYVFVEFQVAASGLTNRTCCE